MKTRSLRNLTIKSVKRLAWLANFFLNPITIFKHLGILPVRTISYKDFSPMGYQDQAVFSSDHPRSIRADANWISTPTSSMVMGHLLDINNGLVSGSGYVFDESGRLIEGASHRYSRKIKRALVSHPSRLWPHIEKYRGEVAAITASNQDAYFHWLFDLLPRLKMLEDLGAKPEKIYLQYRYRFQRETLEILNLISSNNIINCDNVPLLSVSRLIVPCHEVMDGREFPEWVITFLRNKFLPKAQVAKDKFPKRLFVSRADALFRRVLNESELFPILENYGFTVVKLEKLSFQEQVSLFRNAEAVVLPHGSGLANLVWCSEGTRVIELLPAQVLDHGYRLSMAVGLDYFFLSALMEDSKICEGTAHSGNIPYDFVVSPQDLIETFQLANIEQIPTRALQVPMPEVKQDLVPEYVERCALGVK